MIAIGSDHAGFALKNSIAEYLKSKGVEFHDYGTYTTDSVDYPDCAKEPCLAVTSGNAELALLFCGTGVGISIAANKYHGIRACCCSDVFSAKFSRIHNDANVLCMGGRVVGAGLAEELVDAFLNNAPDAVGGERHAKRIAKMMRIEQEQ